MASPYRINVPAYEGPLDLLLDLIRKQEMDIHNIPIAKITEQYLDYLHQIEKFDIDVSADFIYMAATLIHIKSKMLLPRDPELEKMMPEEDPRRELAERLLEHERFKSAAEMLHQKRVIEEAVWSNPQINQFLSEDDHPGLAVSLFDLVKTFQDVLERAKTRPVYEIGTEEVSVPDMIKYLRNVFEREGRRESISARELFERQRSRRAMICLFLALLELVKLQAIGLVQKDAFGEIGLKRLGGFESAFAAEQVMTAIDEGYK